MTRLKNEIATLLIETWYFLLFDGYERNENLIKYFLFIFLLKKIISAKFSYIFICAPIKEHSAFMAKVSFYQLAYLKMLLLCIEMDIRTFYDTYGYKREGSWNFKKLKSKSRWSVLRLYMYIRHSHVARFQTM